MIEHRDEHDDRGSTTTTTHDRKTRTQDDPTRTSTTPTPGEHQKTSSKAARNHDHQDFGPETSPNEMAGFTGATMRLPPLCLPSSGKISTTSKAKKVGRFSGGACPRNPCESHGAMRHKCKVCTALQWDAPLSRLHGGPWREHYNLFSSCTTEVGHTVSVPHRLGNIL